MSVSRFHLAPSLHAAFTNPTVFNPDSVIFDPQNPSANMCEVGGTPQEPAIGDCNTTDMFRDAETQIKKDHGDNAQLLPLELWIDTMPLSLTASTNSLEPITITPILIKRSIRAQPEAGFHIGFIRKLPTGPINESQELDTTEQARLARHVATAKGSLQDYHAMISTLLEELKDIQGTGLHWNWSWIGPGFKDEDVLLVPRIFFVKGDSPGHDKFCCLRGGSGNPQCRYCDCPFDEMDSADFSLKATNMADLAKWTGHAGSCFKNLDKVTKLGCHTFF